MASDYKESELPQNSAKISKVVTPAKSIGSTPYEALNSDVGWNDNVLSSLQQPTYHIRFFMTEDRPIIFSQYSSYDELYKSISNLKQTTIAESGITGTNIASLTVDTIAGPNPTNRSVAATKFKFVIKEPLGVGFMDTIAETARELKVKNYAKCFYYLEISFMGYREDGSIYINPAVPVNPCSEFKNKGKWLYQIGITEMDVDVDAGGSSYDITAVPYEQRLLDDGHLRLPDIVSPEGKTVGEILNNLAKGLNDSVENMYGFKSRSYEFKFADLEVNGKKYDISSWAVTPEQNPEYSTKRSQSMEVLQGGVIKAHFARGSTLGDIVDQVFANSEMAQKLAKDVQSSQNIEVTEKKFRECVIFKIQPTIEAEDYDETTQDYILKYTIHVQPYYTQKPILDDTQIDNVASPEVQSANVLKLRKNGFLVKRYDYLYTGVNTEVLNLDMKLNLKWSAVLPRTMGFRNSLESNTVNDKKNPTTNDIKLLQSELQSYGSAISQMRTDLDKNNKELENLKKKEKASDADAQRTKEITEANTTLTSAITVYEEQQNRLKGQIKSDRDNVQARAKQARGVIPTNRERIKYAEEVLEQEQKERTTTIPITLSQAGEDTRFITSGAFPDSYTRDRSIYGAILDQVYGPMSNQQQSITLEIKGDPYWLGMGNLERSFNIEYLAKKNTRETINKEQQDKKDQYDPSAPVADINRPDYSKGDIMFLISYKYPRGFTELGVPDIKSNDFFSGVYAATTISHRFDSGQFTQTISAIRMPLIDVFKAFGYRSEEMIKSQKEHDDSVKQARQKNIEKRDADAKKQNEASK